MKGGSKTKVRHFLINQLSKLAALAQGGAERGGITEKGRKRSGGSHFPLEIKLYALRSLAAALFSFFGDCVPRSFVFTD